MIGRIKAGPAGWTRAGGGALPKTAMGRLWYSMWVTVGTPFLWPKMGPDLAMGGPGRIGPAPAAKGAMGAAARGSGAGRGASGTTGRGARRRRGKGRAANGLIGTAGATRRRGRGLAAKGRTGRRRAGATATGRAARTGAIGRAAREGA